MRVLKVRKSLIVMATGIFLVSSGVATARATEGTPGHKVWICHATSSDSNPYEIINVDVASARYRGHLRHKLTPNKTWKDAGTFGGASHAAGQAKADVIGEPDEATAPPECFDTPSSSTTSSTTSSTSSSTTSSTTSSTSSSTTSSTSSSDTTSSTSSSTTSSDTSTSGTSTSSATTPDEAPVSAPEVGVSPPEGPVEVLGVTATARTPAKASVKVLTVAGASANPLPAAAAAGEADTDGQLALGGFAGLAAFLLLGAGFILRRRDGEA